jgi:hypothetical protein
MSTNTLARLSRRPWTVLAFISALCMELCWVALWVSLMVRTQVQIPFWRAFAGLAVICLTSYLVDQRMVRQNIRLRYRRIVLAGILIASTFAGLALFLDPREVLGLRAVAERVRGSFLKETDLLPVEFVIMVASLLLSWRGLILANRQLDAQSVIAGFRTGVIMLFLYGLIYRVKETPLSLVFYLFLFSGLLAMSTTRLGMQSRLRGGKAIQFNRKWLAGLLFSIVTVVIFSYLIAQWLILGGIDRLHSLVTTIMSVLVWLASPLVWIVNWLIAKVNQWVQLSLLLKALAELARRIQLYFNQLMETLRSWFAYLEDLFNWLERPTFTIPRSAVLWGTLLFLAIIVLLTIGRRRLRNGGESEEDQTSEEEADLFDLLRAGVLRALAQLRQGIEDIVGLRQLRGVLAAARIRRIYASLLKLSARMDTPRPKSSTPLEFLTKLERLFPSRTVELDMITQAYVRVRYGEIPESGAVVEAVERAWKDVSKEGAMQIHAFRRK